MRLSDRLAAEVGTSLWKNFLNLLNSATHAGERAHWIRVHGSWIPRHILGRFHALFANLRCLWASVSSTSLFSAHFHDVNKNNSTSDSLQLAMLLSNDCDVVIVDQVGAHELLLHRTDLVYFLHY